MNSHFVSISHRISLSKFKAQIHFWNTNSGTIKKSGHSKKQKFETDIWFFYHHSKSAVLPPTLPISHFHHLKFPSNCTSIIPSIRLKFQISYFYGPCQNYFKTQLNQSTTIARRVHIAPMINLHINWTSIAWFVLNIKTNET